MTTQRKINEHLLVGLQEIAVEATYSDIRDTATKLDIAQSTVYEYLKGNVAKESRGRAILNELRKLIIKRNAPIRA